MSNKNLFVFLNLALSGVMIYFAFSDHARLKRIEEQVLGKVE